MALSNAGEVEALAKKFTVCADVIHKRLMKAIEEKDISQTEAQLLFQDETILRQRANGLYIDAANCVIAGLSLDQDKLAGVVDTATREIRKIKQIAAFIDLTADLLLFAAAAYAAKPGPIAATLKEVADDIKALQKG